MMTKKSIKDDEKVEKDNSWIFRDVIDLFHVLLTELTPNTQDRKTTIWVKKYFYETILGCDPLYFNVSCADTLLDPFKVQFLHKIFSVLTRFSLFLVKLDALILVTFSNPSFGAIN